MADWWNKDRKSGTTNIAVTIPPEGDGGVTKPFFLEEVRLTLTGTTPGVTNDFTVTLDADAGSAYDMEYLRQSMSGVTHVSFRPEREVPFEEGDRIDFAWTNGSALTWGLSVYYRGMWQMGNT